MEEKSVDGHYKRQRRLADWFEVGLEDLSDKPTYVQVIASRDGNFLAADFGGV